MLSILQLITSIIMLLFFATGVIVLLKFVQILNKLDEKLGRWNPRELRRGIQPRKDKGA